MVLTTNSLTIIASAPTNVGLILSTDRIASTDPTTTHAMRAGRVDSVECVGFVLVLGLTGECVGLVLALHWIVVSDVLLAQRLEIHQHC